MERFDRNNWNPVLYTEVVEINNALKKWGILEKKEIAAIHTIGLACVGLDNKAWNILRKAGVPKNEATSEKYLWRNNILLPCEVMLCEPVIFVFNDYSTLELMPHEGKGLFMSVNQIGADIVDGTNNSNIDSARLFYRTNGMSISEITMIKKEATQYTQTEYRPTRSSIECQIYLKRSYSFPDYGLALSQSTSEEYYKFWLTDGHCSKAPFGYATYDITLGEFEKSIEIICQIPIIEGHDCSSYFWIMPVKPDKEPKHAGCYDNVDEYREQEISIEEDDIHEFLYYFLDKYYDTDFPYEELEIRNNDDGCFEWHLEHNIYSYETIEQMLKDIEHSCILLETDYDNPELDGVKDNYYYRHFVSYNSYKSLSWDTPPEAQKRIIRENIGVAIDFYRRFVWRMRSMMANSPDYDLISFMGP